MHFLHQPNLKAALISQKDTVQVEAINFIQDCPIIDQLEVFNFDQVLNFALK
jgi:hypothetical protein